MTAIPPLPELKFIAIDPAVCGLDGRRLCYMESGNGGGLPVVLLHGIGSNSAGWRFVLDSMGKQRRVLAWNAPGYLLSENFLSDSPTNLQYADALLAFLDALALDQIYLAGSSFGSLIAATFAARYPERVKRLALLGSSRGQKWLSNEERQRRLKMRHDSIKNGALDLAATRWSNLVAADTPPATAALVQEVLKATNTRGFLQSVQATTNTDVMEFAGKITAPTLLMVGNEDRVNPPEISKMIQTAIPDAELVELPGVGHLSKLEAPSKTVEMLERHFKEAA